MTSLWRTGEIIAETTFAVFELKVKGEILSKFLTNQAPSFAF